MLKLVLFTNLLLLQLKQIWNYATSAFSGVGHLFPLRVGVQQKRVVMPPLTTFPVLVIFLPPCPRPSSSTWSRWRRRPRALET